MHASYRKLLWLLPCVALSAQCLLSGNALLQEIYEERFRELSFEGHRWFDLRRTSQPEIVHTLKGKTYTLRAGDPRYTIRIPMDAIANNPLLNE